VGGGPKAPPAAPPLPGQAAGDVKHMMCLYACYHATRNNVCHHLAPP
jgi:hypothetical protein